MNRPLRIIELFAGLGAPRIALDNLNIKYESALVVENDKHVIDMYNIIHSTNHEPIDILELNEFPQGIDYLHASPPRQAFSSQGKQLGASDSRGERLWAATLNVIAKCEPWVVTIENVPGFLHKKHDSLYNYITTQLKRIGYTYEVITPNAKDYNTPQNRQRVFIMAARHPDYLKGMYQVLEAYKTKEAPSIRQIMEINVPGLRYGCDQLNGLKNYTGAPIWINEDMLANQVAGEINKVAFLGGIKFNSDRNFYGIDGISPTITTSNPSFKNKILFKNEFNEIRYRELTLYEISRIMGFDDHIITGLIGHFHRNKIIRALGNSIVIPVMEAVISSMFIMSGEEMAKALERGTIKQLNASLANMKGEEWYPDLKHYLDYLKNK